jgi:arabinogalactan endo-1,4-beta-galactosidase
MEGKRIITCVAAGMLALGLGLTGCGPKAPGFSFGADISFVPQSEARGVVYLDTDSTAADICRILAGHHFDNIRLRIFVDPTAEKGYSKDGFCGLESTLGMAKRIKAAGMKFTLDFHYSDNWADPDKQYKPSAWEELPPDELAAKVYDYTRSVLLELKKAGAAPDVVQLGNEINHGFLWPDGYIDDNAAAENWASMLALYLAGQKAAREALPQSQLMVHLALGGENNLCRQFLDSMLSHGAEFDIIGLSYYEQWHETYADLQANLYDLSARYSKPVCVCEYGAGRENIAVINDIVRSVPNGLGYGTMAWEPVRTLFPSPDGSRFPRSAEAKEVRLRASGDLFAIYDSLYLQYSSPAYSTPVAPPSERTVANAEQIIGADISWVPQQEAKGASFSDKGAQADVLAIMKANRFNWIRLRLFVDPAAEKGYSSEGFCGTEQTIAMARRIKAAGMQFLLDFHYSDNWADPGKQYTPAAWASYSGSGLEGQLYRYTNETLKRFIAEGVRPDMVQIGNEINHGFLWPQGKIGDSYMPFGVLLRCASAGVRAADPSIPVMVHIACGGQSEESQAFFDKIISRDVKFDIIGQSYYPRWHGTLDDLARNLNNLALRYGKPIIVVEYQEHAEEVNRIVRELPDKLGWGTFIWEATSPKWGNLFDDKGRTTDRMNIYQQFYNSL